MDGNGVVYLKNMGIGIQYTMRISRWSKNKVMDRLFEVLQKNNMVKVECLGLDSTFVKVHTNVTGVLKKMGHNLLESLVEDGQAKFIWSTKMLEVP